MYETYYMKVYSFVMTMAKDQTIAEDITQETFYKAITTENKFRGESDEFTWLCQIAKNLYIDWVRKKSKETGISENGEIDTEIADDKDGPEAEFIKQDMAFQIHMALHELEEPYKEVFSLRCFGELSFAKIGTIFGKTENWARVTYHRAKQKIIERMEK